MRVMQIVDDVIAKSQSNLLKRQQASLRVISHNHEPPILANLIHPGAG